MEPHEILQAVLEQSGGHIPTFRPRFRVDVSALPGDQRDALAMLLRNAGVLAEQTSAGENVNPDALTYELTLRSATDTHRVSFYDQPASQPGVDALANWMRAHGTP